MPAAMASTFLAAPPISTPRDVGRVVEAEGRRARAPAPDARARSASAARERHGGRQARARHRLAKLGPDSTAGAACGAASAMTCAREGRVPRSMPLAQDISGRARRDAARRGGDAAQLLRRHHQEHGLRTASAAARSAVTATFGSSAMPGR